MVPVPAGRDKVTVLVVELLATSIPLPTILISPPLLVIPFMLDNMLA
jgi:hypothetical protein